MLKTLMMVAVLFSFALPLTGCGTTDRRTRTEANKLVACDSNYEACKKKCMRDPDHASQGACLTQCLKHHKDCAGHPASY